MESVRNCGQFYPDCTVSQPRRQQTHLHNRHPENCKTFCPHVTFMAFFQPTALFLVSLLLYVLLPSCLFSTVRFTGCSNTPPSLLYCCSETATFSSQFKQKKAQKHSESHRGPCVCSDRGNCIIGKDLVRTAQQTHSVSVIKTSQLMLYREIIAVCSQIHTKHINTLCGQNVELYIKTQSVPRSKHTPYRL